MTPGSQQQSASDDVLRAIAHDDRRAILTHLDERYERAAGETVQVTISDLRAHVENHAPGPPTDGGRDPDRNYHITLHHRDLPLLDEAGLLNFDRERGRVRYPAGECWTRLVDDVIEQ